jgi:hypothetical protein
VNSRSLFFCGSQLIHNASGFPPAFSRREHD